jgi:hypothetical protein
MRSTWVHSHRRSLTGVRYGSRVRRRIRGNPAQKRKEGTMSIGLGTILLILFIVVIFMMMRRSRA